MTTNSPVAPTVQRVNLCIVGPGYGGRLVAAKATESGASVIHVSLPEGNANLSGPAIAPRALVESANLFHTATRISTLVPGMPHEGKVAADISSKNGLLHHLQHACATSLLPLSDARLRALQVPLLTGEAQFEDAKTLRLSDKRIVARRFVLAPANQWMIPAIPGLNEIDYLTPDQPLVTARPIERLVVIGTSAAAFALAQAHRRLGAWVALVPTPDFRATSVEDEITRQILMGLEHDGICLRLNSTVTRLEACGNETIVHTSTGEALTVSHVLIAPTLGPVFSPLGWERAQIIMDGQIPVLDDQLRTSNRRIHIIGATITDNVFSTVLESEANQIVDHAVLRRKHAKAPVTYLIPTTPEIATVGLDEEGARQRYGKINIVRSSFAMHPLHLSRNYMANPVAGEIKVIATRKGTIVGCAIIGEGAADIAGLWVLAITRGLKLADLAYLSFPDQSHHSIIRQAVRASVFGWPKSRGTMLRLSRWWHRLWS